MAYSRKRKARVARVKAALVTNKELIRFYSDMGKMIGEQIDNAAWGHLYDFAGTLRTVNMSKGGFTFPAARFLHQACANFDHEWLKPLNSAFTQEADLINHLAGLHAEQLYIHPYREGNGRTARLFTNLVLIKHELPELNFDRITPGRMEEYIVAVQSAANKNYTPMQSLFNELRA